jgi:hypothetical protein
VAETTPLGTKGYPLVPKGVAETTSGRYWGLLIFLNETPHYKALANHFPKLERIELSAMKLKAHGYDSMI